MDGYTTTQAEKYPSSICKIVPGTGDADGETLGVVLIVGVTLLVVERVGVRVGDTEIEPDTEQVGVTDDVTDTDSEILADAEIV
jgi:hypothetical protein